MARNPTCLSDSVEMYVQHQDATSNVIAATATVAASVVSADQTNTFQKGAVFYVQISSVSVNTATLAVNVNGKDAISGLYFPVARVSIDGMNVTTASAYTGIIYPGIGTTGLPANASAANGILPAVFQVQATLSVTTSAGMSGTVSYRVGMSKIL
jgi:hypothetical protein